LLEVCCIINCNFLFQLLQADISYVAAVVEFNPKGAATLNPDDSSVALDLVKYLAFVINAKAKVTF
jgi:hypothetical protein